MPSAPQSHIEDIRDQFAESKGTRIQSSGHSLLELVSSEHSSDALQFLAEIIQNVEDNEYPNLEGAPPTLKLDLLGQDPDSHPDCVGALLLFNNECGFVHRDVEAICHAGKSSKKDKGRKNGIHGSIGEMGIGFKTVFMVSPKPHVFSRHPEGAYAFCFGKDDEDIGLGYMVPRWVESVPEVVESMFEPSPELSTEKMTNTANAVSHTSHAGGTVMLLPLYRGIYSELVKKFQDMPPEYILFLPKLQCLSLGIRDAEERFEIKRLEDPECKGLVNLSCKTHKGTSTSTSYWKAQQRITVPASMREKEGKRKHVAETEITIAFPLSHRSDVNDRRKYARGHIFVYLPTAERTDLPFLVNADFILNSNREHLRQCSSGWNEWLLAECVPEAFITGLQGMVSSPVHRDQALAFLPIRELQGEHARFNSLVHATWKLAKQTQCILTVQGELVRPEEALLLPEFYLRVLDSLSAYKQTCEKGSPSCLDSDSVSSEGKKTSISTPSFGKGRLEGARALGESLAASSDFKHVVNVVWQHQYPEQLRKVLVVKECKQQMYASLFEALDLGSLSSGELCALYECLGEDFSSPLHKKRADFDRFLDQVPLLRLQGHATLQPRRKDRPVYFQTEHYVPIKETGAMLDLIDKELNEKILGSNIRVRCFLHDAMWVKDFSAESFCRDVGSQLMKTWSNTGSGSYCSDAAKRCVSNCVALCWFGVEKLPHRPARLLGLVPIVVAQPGGRDNIIMAEGEVDSLLKPLQFWEHKHLYEMLDMRNHRSCVMLSATYDNMKPGHIAFEKLCEALGAKDAMNWAPQQCTCTKEDQDAGGTVEALKESCRYALDEIGRKYGSKLHDDDLEKISEAHIDAVILDGTTFNEVDKRSMQEALEERVSFNRSSGWEGDRAAKQRYKDLLERHFTNGIHVVMDEALKKLRDAAANRRNKIAVTHITKFTWHPGFAFLYQLRDGEKYIEEVKQFAVWLNRNQTMKNGLAWTKAEISFSLTGTRVGKGPTVTTDSQARLALRTLPWMPVTAGDGRRLPIATLPPKRFQMAEETRLWVRAIELTPAVMRDLELPSGWDAHGYCKYLKGLVEARPPPDFLHVVELYTRLSKCRRDNSAIKEVFESPGAKLIFVGPSTISAGDDDTSEMWISLQQAVWKEEEVLLRTSSLVSLTNVGYEEDLKHFFLHLGVGESLPPEQALEMWAHMPAALRSDRAVLEALFRRIVEVYGRDKQLVDMTQWQNLKFDRRQTRSSERIDPFVLNERGRLIPSSTAFVPDDDTMRLILEAAEQYSEAAVWVPRELPRVHIFEVYKHFGVRMLSSVGTCERVKATECSSHQDATAEIVLNRNARWQILKEWFHAGHTGKKAQMKQLLRMRERHASQLIIRCSLSDPYVGAESSDPLVFLDPKENVMYVVNSASKKQPLQESAAAQISKYIADFTLKDKIRLAISLEQDPCESPEEALPQAAQDLWDEAFPDFDTMSSDDENLLAKFSRTRKKTIETIEPTTEHRDEDEDMDENTDADEDAMGNDGGQQQLHDHPQQQEEAEPEPDPDPEPEAEVEAEPEPEPDLEPEAEVEAEPEVDGSTAWLKTYMGATHRHHLPCMTSRKRKAFTPDVASQPTESSSKMPRQSPAGARVARMGLLALKSPPCNALQSHMSDKEAPGALPGVLGKPEHQRSSLSGRWGQKAEDEPLSTYVAENPNTAMQQASVKSWGSGRKGDDPSAVPTSLVIDSPMIDNTLPTNNFPHSQTGRSTQRDGSGAAGAADVLVCTVTTPLRVSATTVAAVWRAPNPLPSSGFRVEIVEEPQSTSYGAGAGGDKPTTGLPPPFILHVARPRCIVSGLRPTTGYQLRVGCSPDPPPMPAQAPSTSVPANPPPDAASSGETGSQPQLPLRWSDGVQFCTRAAAPKITDVRVAAAPACRALHLNIMVPAGITKIEIAISDAPAFLRFRTHVVRTFSGASSCGEVASTDREQPGSGQPLHPMRGVEHQVTMTLDEMGITLASFRGERHSIYMKARALVMRNRATKGPEAPSVTSHRSGEYSALATIILSSDNAASRLDLHEWHSTVDLVSELCNTNGDGSATARIGITDRAVAAEAFDGEELEAMESSGAEAEATFMPCLIPEAAFALIGRTNGNGDTTGWGGAAGRIPPAHHADARQQLQVEKGNYVYIPGGGGDQAPCDRQRMCVVARICDVDPPNLVQDCVTDQGEPRRVWTDRVYLREEDCPFRSSRDGGELIGERLPKPRPIILRSTMRRCVVLHTGRPNPLPAADPQSLRFYCRYIQDEAKQSLEDAAMHDAAHPVPVTSTATVAPEAPALPSSPANSNNKAAPLMFGDLFCGCGGWSTGLRDAGFQVGWGVDNSADAAWTWTTSHPEGVHYMEDVASFLDAVRRGEDGYPCPGAYPVVVASPPCQVTPTVPTHWHSIVP
eukprot:gene3132-3965_t